MAPPPEPMLLFMAAASSLYSVLWWVWVSRFDDDGIELQYSEGEPHDDRGS